MERFKKYSLGICSALICVTDAPKGRPKKVGPRQDNETTLTLAPDSFKSIYFLCFNEVIVSPLNHFYCHRKISDSLHKYTSLASIE